MHRARTWLPVLLLTAGVLMALDLAFTVALMVRVL